jgi:hypothetical protein
MKEEYWHMDSEGDGVAGPFTTVEEAKADALNYCENTKYGHTTIKIVMVVSESSTKISFATTWTDLGAV